MGIAASSSAILGLEIKTKALQRLPIETYGTYPFFD